MKKLYIAALSLLLTLCVGCGSTDCSCNCSGCANSGIIDNSKTAESSKVIESSANSSDSGSKVVESTNSAQESSIDTIDYPGTNVPNPDLYQVEVSHFAGTWYLDGDPSADYFTIDINGNWAYYERAAGNTAGVETDRGTFTYSDQEGSIYYANSSVLSGVSYRVFEFDTGILVWGDNGVFELAE